MAALIRPKNKRHDAVALMGRVTSHLKLTRRAIQEQFHVSDRTAKRYLGERADAGLIEFDRSEHPGFYRPR